MTITRFHSLAASCIAHGSSCLHADAITLFLRHAPRFQGLKAHIIGERVYIDIMQVS